MRGGYSIVVTEPGMTGVWTGIVQEIARRAPEVFDQFNVRTLRGGEGALLEYGGLSVWLHGSGMVRIAPECGTADWLLREIGRRMGLDVPSEPAP